jgi:ribonuclease Z
MDHITGFDSFFRRHYDRADRVNHLWGPPGTIEIMGHRFQSFVWNLIGSRQSTWRTHDIHPDHVTTARHELVESFKLTHAEVCDATPAQLFRGPGYQVSALTLNHGIPSIGYLVREDDRLNVDVEQLRSLGLKPGPWLKTLPTDQVSLIDRTSHDSETLRQQLLKQTPGQSMAFLTDFIAEDEAERERIAHHVRGVNTLVCECQYRASDLELARRNRHMTSQLVGQLAQAAAPGRLWLTHFSERYQPHEWRSMVDEVRALFPATSVP